MSPWAELAQTTVRSPRVAARQIIALDLGRDVIWTALAAVAAVNTIILHLTLRNAPAQMQVQFPAYASDPIVLFMLLSGMMVLYFHILFWSGQAMGGQGRLYDVVALLVWLQVLRTCVQVVVLGLAFTLPSLAGLLSLAAAVVAFWILLNFLTEGLTLPTLWHALLVLVVSLVGVVLGMGTLIALVGAVATGM